jgi:hypothetical protein
MDRYTIYKVNILPKTVDNSEKRWLSSKVLEGVYFIVYAYSTSISLSFEANPL